MPVDKKLLAILVCPICKGDLTLRKAEGESTVEALICPVDHLAFPVRDDIPIMLESEAEQLPQGESS